MSESLYFQGGSWNQGGSSSDWYYNTTAGSVEPAPKLYVDGELSADGNEVWIKGKWVNVWKDDEEEKTQPLSYTISNHSHWMNDTRTEGDKINKIIDILDQMANALENSPICEGIKEQINVLKESASYWPSPNYKDDNDYPEKADISKEFEWYLPKQKDEKIELEEELFEI
jgi:hypothetical protein